MSTLLDLPKGVPGFEIPRLLGGRRATRDAIIGAVRELLADLGPADHATLFFAGHGLQGPDGAFYMALHGTNLDDITGTALPWAEVAELLADSPARITIMLDACHAGAADGAAFASNDGTVAGLSALPSNVTILAASKGRQLAKEDGARGGGRFSLALREVLVEDRTAHDADGNGRIEASELADGLSRLVSDWSNGEQTPWMTKGRIVGDHALF